MDRIMERKRCALVDLSNTADAPARSRARLEVSTTEESGDKVAVQRFTLVSRGAPPAKRAPALHSVLLAPQRVAAELGESVQICRCSECDRTGLRRRMSGTRLCRRDTESHPEYALLLNMSDRFEAECSNREGASELVTEACCREKTAYFILGASSTTVGYIAAEVKANRKVKRVNESMGTDAGALGEADDDIPLLLQVYVEPEFRQRGYALEALKLLVRDHQTLRVDAPAESVTRILDKLGFAPAATEDSDGRPLTTYVRTLFYEDVA